MNDRWKYISLGLFRTILCTTILVFIFALISNFTDINTKVTYGIYISITMVSLVYGVIYAVKRIDRDGWLNGLIIAVLYVLMLYFISVISGRGFGISLFGFIRIAIALLIGVFAGMLGVNIGRED